MTKIRQYDVWIADLDPRFGSEPGKVRPVCIIQTDLLNNTHPSTLILPITTNVIEDAKILRVHLKNGEAGLNEDSDILIDQARAIDNKRLLEKTGTVPVHLQQQINDSLKIVMDLV